MSNLTNWNSKSRIDTMRHQMERIMQEMDQALGTQPPMPAGVFVPAIEMFTRDGAVILKAELPGFEAPNLSLTLDERTLILAGERRRGDAIDDGDFHLTELTYGAFTRRVALPGPVAADASEATFESGLLTIRMPLQADADAGVKPIAITSRI